MVSVGKTLLMTRFQLLRPVVGTYMMSLGYNLNFSASSKLLGDRAFNRYNFWLTAGASDNENSGGLGITLYASGLRDGIQNGEWHVSEKPSVGDQRRR